MATEFITTDPGGIVFLDDGDAAFVVHGVNVTSGSNAFNVNVVDGSSAGNYEITVAGNVYADDDFMGTSFISDSFGPEANVYLNIAAGGSVIVGGDLFAISASDPDISSAELVVNNAGFLGVGEAAVFASGFDTIEFINSGVLTQTGKSGTQQSQDLFDNLGDGDTKIVNHGLIQTAQGSRVLDDVLEAGSELEIVNTGIINGADETAINVGGTLGNVFLDNSGTIFGDLRSELTLELINAGTYNGSVFATSSDDDSVENSGFIRGEIELGAGHDEIRNSGVINKRVDLGTGDDMFKMQGNGSVSNSINGASGNDTIRGGNFDDTLNGDADDDLLRGKGGEDDLDGGTGNDTLFGGNDNDNLIGDDGDDELRGGNGDDTLLGGGNKDELIGGNGNDTLEGGAGNDTLRGGTGNDTLSGQNGSDDLSGGLGADLFLFTGAAQSAVGNRDDILDFQQGQDKIDIDGLSNDTFAFLGNGAFTASGDAEVRVTSNAAGNSVVRIDTDGDGNADSEINVLGVTGLEAGDFIL